MTTATADQKVGKKRKRTIKSTTSEGEDEATNKILQLETKATTSPKHYNNIATLLAIAIPSGPKANADPAASLALCRVFTRLFASAHFRHGKTLTKEEVTVQKWLEDRYNEFATFHLTNMATSTDLSLTIVMKLVQSEVCCQGHTIWAEGSFLRLLKRLYSKKCDTARAAFIQGYFQKFDDVRMNTLQLLPLLIEHMKDTKVDLVSISMQFMNALGDAPKTDSDLPGEYFTHGKFNPLGEISNIVKLAKVHRKKGQEAWLAILGLPLDKSQKKDILKILVHRIVPWIASPERLMDFLTDSFNDGGEMSLLSLSGLFYLIQEKNLDYPSFYQKLYSLLDDGLLHSKHRSRFFRLLDTFMSSTHLPAALVASFIKRLSRLALHAPPAGIVVVIPWIYNMFKRHPSCTFMMHREPRTEEEKEDWEQYGMEDPFNMFESNPMETNAFDSCVWELEMLQSHYHPNVATLAKIISEQFTKQQYNLEDFLDYSYNSLLDTELSRDLKKTPVVEYQIPKYILRDEDGGQGPLGTLLQSVLDQS